MEQKAYCLMVIASFVWAGAFIAGKFAVPYIPTFTLMFLRFCVASIVLFPVLKMQEHCHPEEKFQLSRCHVPLFLFTGIIGMFGYHVLFFAALKYTTAISSSIIGAMNPIITTVLSGMFLKDKIPKLQVLGICISFIGVLLTIYGGNISVLAFFQFNKGDIFMLCAVICWAVYAVVSRSKGSGIPAIALTFYSFLFCTVFLIPFVLWEKPWHLMSIPASAFLAVVFMAVFSSVIGYLFQQIAIKQIGAARSSIFVNLVPVFSIFLSVLILHEVLQPIKLLATSMIIAGVCVCQYAGSKAFAVGD